VPWDCGQPMHIKRVDGKYCTHLAINWRCTEEIDQGNNYDSKAGQARSGVNLSRGWIRQGKLKVRSYDHVPILSIDSVDVVG
jgi:hypothetical protein